MSAQRRRCGIAIADAVVAQLKAIDVNMDQMPKLAVQTLLSTIAHRIVIDMETKAVEVQMMPSTEIFLGATCAA